MSLFGTILKIFHKAKVDSNHSLMTVFHMPQESITTTTQALHQILTLQLMILLW